MSDSNILTFGKYNKKTIEEVYQIDPGYCRWLLNQDILTNKSEAVKAFLLTKFSSGDKSHMLSFGKHKGKTVDWVKANDSNYLEWLSRNDYVNENCPKLRAAVASAMA